MDSSSKSRVGWQSAQLDHVHWRPGAGGQGQPPPPLWRQSGLRVNHAEARRVLQAKPLLDLPDKAWAALADQLEHSDAGQPWDGVFRFREK